MGLPKYSRVYRGVAKLRYDGKVETSGDEEVEPYEFSAFKDSSSVVEQLKSGVIRIEATSYAFAAIKDDGSVVTWGTACFGGDSSRVANQLTNIDRIDSTECGFIAFKTDGSEVKWGQAR